jgi:hypothetical protein
VILGAGEVWQRRFAVLTKKILAFAAFDGTQALFSLQEPFLNSEITRCIFLMMTFACYEVVEVRGRTTKKW